MLAFLKSGYYVYNDSINITYKTLEAFIKHLLQIGMIRIILFIINLAILNNQATHKNNKIENMDMTLPEECQVIYHSKPFASFQGGGI